MNQLATVENVRSISELLGFQQKSQYTAIRTRTSLHEIIALPQPRRTFAEIPEIGMSILFTNLIYLPVLAYFNRENFEKYLQVLSILWRTPLLIEDYLSFGIDDPERGETYYKVLLDGERRIRGCRYYLTAGCDEHPDVAGCYKLHFGDENVEVTLCVNINPVEALLLQSTANSHNRVPPHEDAQFLDNLFRMFRICDPKFPLTKFSRLIGRSPDTVRNAVRFCLLPQDIQIMVPEMIPYGIGCEVARLQEIANVPEAELKDWAKMAALNKSKVPEFKKSVTDFINMQQNGQTSMLALMTKEQQEELKKYSRRSIVARHTIQAIWSCLDYFTLVLRMFENGLLGKEDSPFSVRSPVRVLRTLVEKEKQLLPHLEGLLPQVKYEEAQDTLQKAEVLLSRLEAVAAE